MTSIIVNNHGDNDSSDNNGKATGLTTAGGRPGLEPFSVYCFPSSFVNCSSSPGGRPGQEPFFVYCFSSSFVNCSSSPGGRPGQEPDRQPAATSLSGEDSSCSTHGSCFSSYLIGFLLHTASYHPIIVIIIRRLSFWTRRRLL